MIDDLTLGELKMIHDEHNQENDCDCEECREYRRIIGGNDEME